MHANISKDLATQAKKTTNHLHECILAECQYKLTNCCDLSHLGHYVSQVPLYVNCVVNKIVIFFLRFAIVTTDCI